MKGKVMLKNMIDILPIVRASDDTSPEINKYFQMQFLVKTTENLPFLSVMAAQDLIDHDAEQQKKVSGLATSEQLLVNLVVDDSQLDAVTVLAAINKAKAKTKPEDQLAELKAAIRASNKSNKKD